MKIVKVVCFVLFIVNYIAVVAACSKDEDCFLNGVCTNGNCVCDYSWTGTTCTTMKFQPAPLPSGYGYSPNVTAWGGIPILGPDNQWHLYNTEIINHCGLCNWGDNSRVIHAVSSTLLGPYKYQNEALPIWSHNPHALVDHSTGTPTYLLFHIGDADGGKTPKVCSAATGLKKQGETKEGPHIPRRRAPMASGILHSATNPAGPWTPQNPQGLGGCNNPAPYIFPNGTIHMICSQGGNNYYTAPSWKGPWKSGQLVFSGDAGVGTWEDPFIWVDKRGHFKMIWHVYMPGGTSQHYWDRISGFGYSTDGIHWVRQPWQPYTNQIQHTSSTVNYTTRERPKIVFDKDGYTPLALFTGVARGTNCYDCKLTCGQDWTFNLAQAFAA